MCYLVDSHKGLQSGNGVDIFSDDRNYRRMMCSVDTIETFVSFFSLVFLVNVTTPKKDTQILSCRKNQKDTSMENLRKKFFSCLTCVFNPYYSNEPLWKIPSPVPNQNKVSDTTHFDGHCLWHFGENKKLCKLSLRAETKGKLGFLQEQIRNKELYSIIIIRKGKNEVTFGWKNPIRRNSYDNVASPSYILLRLKFQNMGQGTTVIIWQSVSVPLIFLIFSLNIEKLL